VCQTRLKFSRNVNECKPLLHGIASSRVTIIEGDTGCGKTTQVPQYILEDAVSHQCFFIIVD